MIEERPSPNFGERQGGVRPDMVVLHYTGMASATAALERLTDLAAEVSAHYLVLASGRVFRLIDEAHRAWHAGEAVWGDVTDVNSRSIGIEIANPGHDQGYQPFPEPQMAALEALVTDILARRAIPPERVLGHACVAPGRKIDPGEKFDWRRLARAGAAVWLDAPPSERGGGADAGRFQTVARRFGYGAPATGRWDQRTLDVWDAYLRRFRPAETGSAPHWAGLDHLERLAARWPVALDAAARSA